MNIPQKLFTSVPVSVFDCQKFGLACKIFGSHKKLNVGEEFSVWSSVDWLTGLYFTIDLKIFQKNNFDKTDYQMFEIHKKVWS